jgi:hypothetical protein
MVRVAVSEVAFKLSWDRSFLHPDDEITASMVPFAGAASVSLLLTRALEIPEPVDFEANVETIRQVDYPDNDKRWPIMSERMRAILLPGAPRYRLIRVLFLDDTGEGDAIDGFAAIQFLEHIDALDLERSEVTPDPDFLGEALSVKRYVLKDMPLPPIFRLSAYAMHLFVSHEARRALEAAGIKGVSFEGVSRLFY